MLESLVAWVLNNYVGEYFKLNTDQLSIALLQGQIDLENVPLRTTALRKFDIPVQVKCGVIGKLQLQVPLAYIRSQPWILRMSDFLVLLGPCTSVYDVEIVDNYQQQKREKMLDELEMTHKRKLLTQLGIEPTEEQQQQTNDSWWGASLLSTVSNNIQIILNNMHIRYECPDYTFGVKIQSLKIQTTNPNWRPGFVQPLEDMNTFKKIDITGFSIYWNSSNSKQNFDRVLLRVPSYDILKEELGAADAGRESNSFILQPFSLDVRIEKNSSRFPLRIAPYIPRFKLDIRSRKIEMELDKRQIAQIHSLTQDWAQFDRARPHRKWRPIASIKESPRQWWRFAIGRTFDEVQSKRHFRSLKATIARLRLVNAYCCAYQRRLELYMEMHRKKSEATWTTSHEDTALIKQIEHDSQFTYNILHSLREAVFHLVLRKHESLLNNRESNNDSPFEVIQSTVRTTENQRVHHLQTTTKQKQSAHETKQGWYGWITNWFAEGTISDNDNASEDVNEAIYLNMRPPKLIKHSLDPELEDVERRMETEILQVLNESWDDSTILRRDNLLAEIVLNFTKVFFRVNEEDHNIAQNEFASDKSMMFTFDLNRLCSRIRLSPKEHRTELSLSIGDFSVQRLQFMQDAEIASNSTSQKHFGDNFITQTEVEATTSNCDDDESLVCGFRHKNERNTRLLLTVGRTYDEDSNIHHHRMRYSTNMNSSEESREYEQQNKDNNAILRIFYKRLAPKREIYHELNVSSAPLSIICDECALSGMFETYSQKIQLHSEDDQQEQSYSSGSRASDDAVTKQIFLSIAIPELIMELRSQKAARNYLLNPPLVRANPSSSHSSDPKLNFDDDDPLGASSSFVRANIRSLLVTFSRRDCQKLSKLNLDFGNLLLEDTLQGCATEFPLLKMSDDDDGHQQQWEMRKDLSRSCPDLSVDFNYPESTEVAMQLGCSLPTSSSMIRNVKSAESVQTVNKVGMCKERTGTTTMTNGKNERKHSLTVVFVETTNPNFFTLHRKLNCKISGNFKNTEVELGINRRTWILLLDFFGLLHGGSSLSDSTINYNNYMIGCELSAKSVRVGMNYPKNGTQLGICTLEGPKLNLQTDINVVDEPIQIGLTAQGLCLCDTTPFYSNLYSERLNIRQQQTKEHSSQPSIQLSILKYRTGDPQCVLREFDLSVLLSISGSFSYLHTHRFFSAFLDFWMQLADLYDKVALNNLYQQLGVQFVSNELKTRCKLSVDICGTDLQLFVPLNQHSNKAVLFRASALRATNSFCYSSSLSALFDKHLINNLNNRRNASSPDADCLLDAMHISLHDLAITHGIFMSKTRIDQQQKAMIRRGYAKQFEDAFSGIVLYSRSDNVVMDEPNFALRIDIYRNLSAFVSQNVPELFVLFKLQEVVLHFSTEFYKLLRGCLDHNFGEQLIPQPETIPDELLELPEINIGLGEQYSVFALRIILKKVQFLLNTPISSFRPDVYANFARLQIRSAKLFYDSFVDSQSEFDFICESATLEDARQNEHNLFRKIVQADTAASSKKNTPVPNDNSISPKGSHSKKLLFETHIKMRQDEPPIISLILARARVVLLMDWIETLKAFVLLNTDFVPESEQPVLNIHHNSSFEIPKCGVLTRTIAQVSPQLRPPLQHSSATARLSSQSGASSESQQTNGSKFTLKVTLKECELIALEDPDRRDTFALVTHTTAAIMSNNLANQALVESQYEIQQFCLFWCMMDSQSDTHTQLTNDTCATATVYFEHSQPSTKEQSGKSMEHLLAKQMQVISVEFGALILRGSFKDFFISKCVWDKFVERWDSFQEQDIQFWTNSDYCLMHTTTSNLLFPTESPKGITQNSTPKVATKLWLKADQCCAWLLEEGGNNNSCRPNTSPFLRFNISELNIRQASWKCQTSFNLSIDYYRLRGLPGWEPLLEQCRQLVADLNFLEPNQWNVRIRAGNVGPIELNLTQTFIERALDFVPHWNSIRPILFDLPSQGLGRLRHLSHQYRKNSSQIEEETDPNSCTATSASATSTINYSLALAKPKLTEIVEKSNLMRPKILPVDPKHLTNSTPCVDIQLELNQGLGISLVGTDEHSEDSTQQEELCYGRLVGIRLNVKKKNQNYQCCCHINSIQIDNQLLGVDRWHFMFYDPSALKDEPVIGLPALIFELSYTPTEFYDVYECFRLKLCNACILLDEQLLWRLVYFITNIRNRPMDTMGASQSKSSSAEGTNNQLKPLEKNCYFGTFQLEFGNMSLSVLTVDKSILSPPIRQLRDSYSDRIMLFSFENALVTLNSFCLLRYFCNFDNLVELLGNFYLDELKRHKLNIILAMDAFGNPVALGTEVKESFQGLLFEGDLAGFAFGLSYGAANSISRVTSSMAQGVGALTFDDKHEQLRRRMRRAKPEQSGPLTHLYGGIKGLGVGVFGGLTAIAKNTMVAAQEDGFISGVPRGLATGAIDTVTKPLQGTLDLLEGTASAVKELVGAPLVRRAHFPDCRLRIPRVCSSLSGLLPVYAAELAEAQQELLRITGVYTLNDENRLLSVVSFLSRTNLDGARVVQRALIGLLQCYIVRQVNDQPSMVTYRILFKHLKTAQLAKSQSGKVHANARLTPIEVIYHSEEIGRRKPSSHQLLHSPHQQPSSSSSDYPSLTLWCTDRDSAQRFCKQLMRAKALFDRRNGAVANGSGQIQRKGAKKLLPIFTI